MEQPRNGEGAGLQGRALLEVIEGFKGGLAMLAACRRLLAVQEQVAASREAAALAREKEREARLREALADLAEAREAAEMADERVRHAQRDALGLEARAEKAEKRAAEGGDAARTLALLVQEVRRVGHYGDLSPRVRELLEADGAPAPEALAAAEAGA